MTYSLEENNQYVSGCFVLVAFVSDLCELSTHVTFEVKIIPFLGHLWTDWIMLQPGEMPELKSGLFPQKWGMQTEEYRCTLLFTSSH